MSYLLLNKPVARDCTRRYRLSNNAFLHCSLPYRFLLTHSRFIEACDSQVVQYTWRDYASNVGGGRKERK